MISVGDTVCIRSFAMWRHCARRNAILEVYASFRPSRPVDIV